MKRRKNYFLFIVGNFTDSNTVQTNIIDTIHTLTMILNQGNLRYIHHDNLMVCHFQSTETLEDIDWLLSTTLKEDIIAYFLLPKPRQMGVRLEEDLEKHLTDLKSKPTTDNPTIDENISGGFKHIGEIFSAMKEDMGSLFDKIPQDSPDYVKIPTITYTVDDILDKINETGLGSLSKEERNFLDEQSKG